MAGPTHEHVGVSQVIPGGQNAWNPPQLLTPQ